MLEDCDCAYCKSQRAQHGVGLRTHQASTTTQEPCNITKSLEVMDWVMGRYEEPNRHAELVAEQLRLDREYRHRMEERLKTHSASTQSNVDKQLELRDMVLASL